MIYDSFNVEEADESSLNYLTLFFLDFNEGKKNSNVQKEKEF